MVNNSGLINYTNIMITIMIIIIIMAIIIIMIMIIMIIGCKQQRADQLHKHPVWEADRSHLGSFPRPGDRSGPVETEKKTNDRQISYSRFKV